LGGLALNRRESPLQISLPHAPAPARRSIALAVPGWIVGPLAAALPPLAGVAATLAIWYLLAAGRRDVPGPLPTLAVLWSLLADPFYYRGPNEQGVGVQLLVSLGRVFT